MRALFTLASSARAPLALAFSSSVKHYKHPAFIGGVAAVSGLAFTQASSSDAGSFSAIKDTYGGRIIDADDGEMQLIEFSFCHSKYSQIVLMSGFQLVESCPVDGALFSTRLMRTVQVES
jgi:hypothetical protein